MTTLHGDVPCIVLDSNVVLDWALFCNPAAMPIGAAIRCGSLRWLSTEAMRHELEHVLTHVRFTGWLGTATDVLAAWDTWAERVAAPAPMHVTPLRCTDPDDQKFIDLALHAGATALLSRDKAVLRLARRAERFGLKIRSPAAWCEAAAPAA